jgi:hypothetical protein
MEEADGPVFEATNQYCAPRCCPRPRCRRSGTELTSGQCFRMLSALGRLNEEPSALVSELHAMQALDLDPPAFVCMDDGAVDQVMIA